MKAGHIKKLKAGCRMKIACKLRSVKTSAENLFDSEWEVFVIKKDKTTGKLVGKAACCALSPV